LLKKKLTQNSKKVHVLNTVYITAVCLKCVGL